MACPECGSEKGYSARFRNYGDCEVDDKGEWVRDLCVDEADRYGPYGCLGCGHEFEEFPEPPE